MKMVISVKLKNVMILVEEEEDSEDSDLLEDII